MNKNFILAPKALLASILVSFALVGVAMATVYSDIKITAPAQDGVVVTNSPSIAYESVDPGGTIALERRCGFDLPVTNIASVGTTCPASGAQIPGTNLDDGPHTFVIQYRPNSSGVTGVTATAFTVDTTPPTINITAPANGSTIVDETPTIGFSVTGGDIIECSFDGGAFVTCNAAFQAPELAQGQHTLTVRATDPHGNFATASVTFTIDLSAPLDDPLPPESGNVTAGKSKSSANGRNLYVPIKAQILPSPDVSPTAACRGKVKVSIKPKVRRARTYKRTWTLKRSGDRCRASGKISVPKRYKGKRATLRMYFGGNDWMSKISVVKTITL